jgi:hypothetical protein
VESVRQESQLYIVEENKDAYGSMESVRRREPIMMELILLSIEDDEVYIHDSSHERQYVLFKEKP